MQTIQKGGAQMKGLTRKCECTNNKTAAAQEPEHFEAKNLRMHKPQ